MPKKPGRHNAGGRLWRASGRARGRGLNRGDFAILLCGVLGFLSLTFGGPILSHWDAGNPGAAGIHAAQIAAPAAAPPSALPWPLSKEQAGAPGPVSGPASAAADPGLALPAASAPVRIIYPGAAIDAGVHPLEPDGSAVATRTVVPPATMDGYWLTPFGSPGSGSDNTTYVIGHSWEDRDAPFNHLSSRAAVGDEFDVVTATGSIRYRVDSVTTYLKASLKDSPIWDMVPNRVVLISCYTEDPWGKNVVVSASPVRA
ncbi:class F sortase [Pseudarthrobacter sulfonivorans]|uniref:class F sortase n=1 Tax=Pseudarthrobacter sulfonivorans TaxID=121292 RepID=UPI002103B838|nr:class F sortase [Pseudarthrobacter sulfonivorans]